MKRFLIVLLFLFLLISRNAFSETRTISCEPVTTYTDNTVIESFHTVTYEFYWSIYPDFSLMPLNTLIANITNTSWSFDPTLEGMPRETTIYFTAKAKLETGNSSEFSPAYPWFVPRVPSFPGKPILDSVGLGK